MGKKDIEDALKRLDRLTQEEARMAAAHILNLTHAVDNKVTDAKVVLDDVKCLRLNVFATGPVFLTYSQGTS